MTSHGRHCEQEEFLREDLGKASSAKINDYLLNFLSNNGLKLCKLHIKITVY